MEAKKPTRRKITLRYPASGVGQPDERTPIRGLFYYIFDRSAHGRYNPSPTPDTRVSIITNRGAEDDSTERGYSSPHGRINGNTNMFLKSVINQKFQGQDVVNILCWSGSGATLDNAQIMTDYIQQAYQDNLSTFQVNEYTFDSITWYDAEAPLGTPGLNLLPTGGGHQGVSTQAGLPTTVALLLAFQSIVGPPWRGRAYLSGFATGNMEQNGRFASNVVAAAEGLGADLLALGATTGVIATHSIIGGDLNTPIQDRTAIVSNYIGRSNPVTQRRRRIGSGS